MATSRRRLRTNADGPFYVDETCIDCGTCRWMAPEVFDRAGAHSRVHRQPDRPEAERRAREALVACPTGSIGAEAPRGLAPIVAGFPRPWDGPVRHVGFHAASSYGAASWLLLRPGGNLLIDSPRFNRPLARRIEAMGGVRTIFLTHRDDVADHARWAAYFGAERVLHARDRTRDTRDVEHLVRGDDLQPLPGGDEGMRIVPTPGHTPGSACLLVDERWLFTGDHLAWDHAEGRPTSFPEVCWQDWALQTRSVARLRELRFEHVLPGHGAPGRWPAADMPAALDRCVRWMASVG